MKKADTSAFFVCRRGIGFADRDDKKEGCFRSLLYEMVGTIGFEPMTSTVSTLSQTNAISWLRL